jgi:hypothetical protein
MASTAKLFNLELNVSWRAITLSLIFILTLPLLVSKSVSKKAFGMSAVITSRSKSQIRIALEV